MQLEDFANMGLLLQNLNESRLHSRETFKDLPQQGVYVFYDGEKPVYVGHSSRQTISKRLQQHTNTTVADGRLECWAVLKIVTSSYGQRLCSQ